MNSLGMAAQFTSTNARDAKGLWRWMCSANSSFPDPDSPVGSTPTSDRATWVASVTARKNSTLSPVILGASPPSSRNRWFSCCRSNRSSALLTTSRTRSRASGFSRKSKAPLRVASRIVPCPGIMTVGVGSALSPSHRRKSRPHCLRQAHIQHTQVRSATGPRYGRSVCLAKGKKCHLLFGVGSS